MTKKDKKLAEVYHFDLYGTREEKFKFLNENSLASIPWNKLEPEEPNFFFVPKDFEGIKTYEEGFKIDELFGIYNTGIETGRDDFFIDFEYHTFKTKVENIFQNRNDNKILGDYKITNTTSFKFKDNLMKSSFETNKIKRILYRPFDFRYTYYDVNLQRRASYNTLKHLMNKNLALSTCRQQSTFDFQHILITNCIIERCTVSLQTKETGYIFPLYLYPDTTAQKSIEQPDGRVPNLNMEIVGKIAEKIGLIFVLEKNSPPLEGQGVDSPPLEGCPQGGVVNSSCPTDEMVLTTINGTPIIRNFVENLPYNPVLKQLAKNKRKEGILSEVLFWQQVHKKLFYGIDFDRQRIIGNYIVDFYVKTLGLVIEIDGSSHDSKAEYDAERQQYLENLGLKVYRIADIDVKKDIGGVMRGLENYIIQEFAGKTTPNPSKGGEWNTPSYGHPSKRGEFSPIDILDYIYAVLHSPTYRTKYKEFLKIDFPRVPYPKDKETFWQLVKLGSELRQIHLLEHPVVEKLITQYPVDGDNVVRKPTFIERSRNERGSVFINDTQYFANVPEVAWNFYIGGYQPAQKWLKDRKDRTLQFEDIMHYQKIIVALSETDRLMREIDAVEIE